MRRTIVERVGLWLVALAVPAALSAGSVTSPFRAAPQDPLGRAAAPGEERLTLDVSALAALRAAPSGAVEIADFPTGPHARSRVRLSRFEVAAAEARLTITRKDGETARPFPSVAHFKGSVVGEPNSTVYLAAHPGFLTGWVRSSEGFAYVGPGEGGSGFLVRAGTSPSNDLYASTPFRCTADSLPEAPQNPAPASQRPAEPSLAGFQKGALIIETDQELLAKFGGDAEAMAAYVLTIFGAMNLIYERDLAFHLSISEIHAWTTADPWPGPSPDDQMAQLGDWYHANRPLGTFPRAIVHLVSGVAVAGGVALQPALCIDDYLRVDGHWGGAYGVAQIFADYPAQPWDLFVSSHEIGHNLGSPHTHCFAPPIDQCYSGEAGCYAGPTSVPPGGGTLMSYCYLPPNTFDDLNFVFHPRCVNEAILPYIQAANCLTAVPTFPDVPTTHPFFHYIETIYQLGITGGCSGGNYCPSNPVTRAQMAVFLLKAKEGSAYDPPPCTGVFPDVECTPDAGFGDWIEELASRGITGGCGGGLYCPGNTVTRKQMAPFLMKTLYGGSHVPPAAASVFSDVPDGDTFEPWIMELYGLGITGGCATNPLRYCPDGANTRGQMAVFLVKTFALSW